MNKEISLAAKALWGYLKMNQKILKSDCILALGTWDTRVAERTAELYLQGMGRFIIFSGGLGEITKKIWTKKEADIFAEVAIKMGVPSKDIYIENKSTNTGENIRFTKKLVEEKQLNIKNLILVQKPYMERRSYATIRKQWPEVEVIVTSPKISFDEYSNDISDQDMTINSMVGDLQRIMEYPKMGYQIPQAVPEEVIRAFEYLVANGYDKRLIK